jgi:hypothetical protein
MNLQNKRRIHPLPGDNPSNITGMGKSLPRKAVNKEPKTEKEDKETKKGKDIGIIRREMRPTRRCPVGWRLFGLMTMWFG